MFPARILRSNKMIYNLSCYDIQEVFQEKSTQVKPLNNIQTNEIIENKIKNENERKRKEQNLKYLSQK